MKIPLNIPLIISSCAVLFMCSCNTSNRQTTTKVSQTFDSLYTTIQLGSHNTEAKNELILADSLVSLYAKKASQSIPFIAIDPSSSYKGVQLGKVYNLGNDLYGKIVRFEPESNGFYSVQLFVLNAQDEILDAIELAYLFGEEGVDAASASYMIKENNRTKVFTKQYWKTYVGRDAEEIIELDTLIAYEIQKPHKVPLIIDSKLEKKWNLVFDL